MDRSNIRTSGDRGQEGCHPIDRHLSIEDNRRRYAGSGAEDHRTSAFPFEIAPKKDFAPTPIASDSLRREFSFFSLSGVDAGQERYRRRRPRLQGKDSERVVRRPISAKKSDAHQPEESSIVKPFANEREASPNSARLPGSVASTPFSPLRVRVRDAHRGVWQLGLATRGNRNPFHCQLAAAPFTTSAFEWRS